MHLLVRVFRLSSHPLLRPFSFLKISARRHPSRPFSSPSAHGMAALPLQAKCVPAVVLVALLLSFSSFFVALRRYIDTKTLSLKPKTLPFPSHTASRKRWRARRVRQHQQL